MGKRSERMSEPTNDSILTVVRDLLRAEDWGYSEVPDQPVLITEFAGTNGRWRVVFQGFEEQRQVALYSILPVNCPEERRASMAEFLVRANYGMIIGNFELDLSDGEIRYKTSVDVEDDRLTVALVRNLLVANVRMTDRYLPGILQVLTGAASPAVAITTIESDP